MVFDRPIMLQKLDEDTEKWVDIQKLRANINKARSNEYLSSGAIQSTQDLEFKVRYCPPLKNIPLNTQLYRIIYNSDIYDVVDYDDFMLRHRTVKIIGSAKNV